jgi:hypothetical protein
MKQSYQQQLKAIELSTKRWERKFNLAITKLRKLRRKWARVIKLQADQAALDRVYQHALNNEYPKRKLIK